MPGCTICAASSAVIRLANRTIASSPRPARCGAFVFAKNHAESKGQSSRIATRPAARISKFLRRILTTNLSTS
jgi:hypothetical protein